MWFKKDRMLPIKEVTISLFLYHWYIERGWHGEDFVVMVRYKSKDEKAEREFKEKFKTLDGAVAYLKTHLDTSLPSEQAKDGGE